MQNFNSSRIDAILQKNYTVRVGEFISQGWQLVKQNLGGFIGFTLILILINAILGSIPFVPLVIYGPLCAGFYIVAFKLLRNRITAFDDFFGGFSKFLQLFLASLVPNLLILASLIPLALLWGAFIAKFMNAIAATNTTDTSVVFSAAASLPMPGPLFTLLSLLLLIPAIYLSVAYTLAIPFVVDKKLPFWDAMEASRKLISKKWFSWLGLLLVLGLLNFLGAIPFGLGLLITIPLAFCTLAVAYEDIVGLNGSTTDASINN
jgi:hypothetical protein